MKRSQAETYKTRHKHASYRFIILGVFIISLIRLTLVHAQADDDEENAVEEVRAGDPEDEWDENSDGHDTTHEEMGQAHFPLVEYTEYNSKVKYSDSPNFPTYFLKIVFDFTHFWYDHLLTNDPAIPSGYIAVKGSDTLILGQKVEENSWRDLLIDYWGLIFWVVFLVALIVIIPFIAVCYCCFCCCYRCPVGCAPCVYNRDFRLRIICGLLLFLFIIFLCFGLVVAFLSSKLMDRGLEDAANTVRRGSKDTCRFLKDVNEHIHHLFARNYEELLTHLQYTLTNAHKHIMLDLDDTSQANAIDELLRILENMPEALKLMKEVKAQEDELRYLNVQLRDGLRGVKREVHLACMYANWDAKCSHFFWKTRLDFLDVSTCLHLDQLPKTILYVEAIGEIIEEGHVIIPKKALLRLQEISDKVAKAMEKVSPPIIGDLQRGRDKLLQQSEKIRTIIDAVMSDVHLNTLRSTKSFEDVYDKLGPGRAVTNTLVCAFIAAILILLIIALICGCLGSKTAAASMLCVAIIFIFCAFSFIALVGLFYFIIGMVSFQGACAPIQAGHSSHIFNQLDIVINLNEYKEQPGESSYNYQMLKAMKNCRPDQTIFQLLTAHNLYRVNELENLTILTNRELDSVEFKEDLSKMELLTKDERKAIASMARGNLSTYHKSLYFEHLCSRLTYNPIDDYAQKMRELGDDLYTQWGGYSATRNSLYNNANHLDTYKKLWADKILAIQNSMKAKLNKIDEFILYNNRDFGETIKLLLSTILRSEKFIQSKGKEFISSLMINLTEVVKDQTLDYLDMVIRESSTNVGECAPLSYIYYRGVDLVCARLIDPINGFWVGALLSALLLLPLLFVAHRLMCLYRTFMPLGVTGVYRGGGCPTCTGAPYVPPPIYTCSGGQQTYNAQRAVGGTIHEEYTLSEQLSCNESTIEETVQPLSFNKRKQD